jgi:hypothetical protein
MDITVSVDRNGNLVCPDTSSNAGSTVQWTPDPNSVNSIQSVTVSAGTFTKAPSSSNGWTATLGTAADLGGGVFGWQYTIDANTKSNGQKQKAPKILLSTTEKPVHAH